MSARIVLIGGLLAIAQPVSAQINKQGTQYITETLSLDPDAISKVIQSSEAGGEQSRWATLGLKSQKYASTIQQSEAKRRERDLQRQQLAMLADGLRRTKELFQKYYEKYQVVSGAVQTLEGFLKIGKRVRSILDILDQLRVQLAALDEFSDEERDYVMQILTSMVNRTERVLKSANFVLLGNNVPSEELDELREEHGNFMVLLRSIDRTEQLDLIDREISRIISDLQSVVVFLNNIQNNRKNGKVPQAEILRDLLSGN